MDGRDALAEQFEQHRPRLQAVAYRMLGSLDGAEDAVQETWLRLDRDGVREVRNLGGWLTTVVGRMSLNMLRERRSHPEQPTGVHVPDPIVTPVPDPHPEPAAVPYAGTAQDSADPEERALMTESVGLALQVVLDTLDPAERLALVLHDMFAVPFEEISVELGNTPAAARQLASRARRRVQHADPMPDPDPARQRAVVDAFFAASRAGDFDALVAVLDPDVVLRSDGGAMRPIASVILHSAPEVARQAFALQRLAPSARPVLVNGAAGVVVAPHGRPVSVMAFTVRDARVVAIDVLADPARLRRLGLEWLLN